MTTSHPKDEKVHGRIVEGTIEKYNIFDEDEYDHEKARHFDHVMAILEDETYLDVIVYGVHINGAFCIPQNQMFLDDLYVWFDPESVYGDGMLWLSTDPERKRY